MKFSTVNIVTVIAFGLLLMTDRFAMPVPGWVYAAACGVYLVLVVIGCTTLSTNFFIPSLCRAHTDEKIVALTFDDGPHSTVTPAILDILKQHHVQATFFCIGKNVAASAELVKDTVAEGHLVGNHSYSHDFWFDLFPVNKMVSDLTEADKAIYDATGMKPVLFRPPYGVMNPNLAKAVRKGTYTVVGWSIRSFDTARKDKNKLISSLMNKVRPGDIILLHDRLELTREILPELIAKLHSNGFRIERLDKMLKIKGYA